MAGADSGMDQLSQVVRLLEDVGNALYRRFHAEVLGADVEPFMVQPMGLNRLAGSPTDRKRGRLPEAEMPLPARDHRRDLQGDGHRRGGPAGGDLVPPTQRGVIDATEWIGPADDLNLGLNAIWKNHYLQGLHQPTDAGEVIVNKTVFGGLPADSMRCSATPPWSRWPRPTP
ncbi:hypothetical protein [Geminicoccus flavidas]|uniref:hypothetical protein n=1 Tax=Geminicoccus flavidas TaxID=2506407 RepID=UPI001358A1C0|nr:hypothetical protein [Geminicoccus flavidas]